MDEIPFRPYDGWLKQINVNQLDKDSCAALITAFPEFMSFDKTQLMKQAQEHYKDWEHPPDYVLLKDRKERRFAGDYTLPRGRYYTLSRDNIGDDGETLIGELLAYYNPKKAGEVHVLDLAYRSNFEALGLNNPLSAILIIFGARSHQDNPFSSEDMRNAWSMGETLQVLIPYTVERVIIEKVVDLRFPNVQQWFFETFSNPRAMQMTGSDLDTIALPEASEGLGHLFDQPPIVGRSATSFFEMLPTLLDQDFGGSRATHAVGAWLRKHAVDALVYPSARADSTVILDDDAIVDFAGWNLVDYRGAEAPYFDKYLNFINPWDPTLMAPLDIRCRVGGKNTGTWKIVGLLEARQKLYEEQLESVK